MDIAPIQQSGSKAVQTVVVLITTKIISTKLIGEKTVNGLKRKEILKETGVSTNIFNYLMANRKLPVLRETTGPGVPTIFKAPEVLDVIRQHLAKNTM
ncbi:MAG: hypothetical protein GWP19_00640 [Planctomycetia bacterium]|nr:hypothetical protein [Planctomycetia bacterium]